MSAATVRGGVTLLLTAVACLAATAPAAASERSEARKYADAMAPTKITLTPEEGEALVAGYEARSAHIAATCLDAVKDAARDEERSDALGFVYIVHLSIDSAALQEAWMREGDARLAAIRTSSRTLRRGRAARRQLTRFTGRLAVAWPADFCAVVTGWQAKGYKGAAPGLEAFDALVDDADDPRRDRWLERAERALKRHGATRAQRRAFGGTPVWPELTRKPAPDPVAEALGFDRADDDAGARTSDAEATAAASERSEARRYAAAMAPLSLDP